MLVPPSPVSSHFFVTRPPRSVSPGVLTVSLWLSIVGMVVASAGDPRPTGGNPLRPASAEMRWVIEDTAARSVTTRALIARLGCTDAIVYVERTASPQIPTARTKLVATVAGARFIRIGISTTASFADLGPFLAHELQHAVEIAERDDVRDDDAVRALYLKIGRARGGDRYETEAARDVEWVVRSELRAKIGG